MNTKLKPLWLRAANKQFNTYFTSAIYCTPPKSHISKTFLLLFVKLVIMEKKERKTYLTFQRNHFTACCFDPLIFLSNIHSCRLFFCVAA